MGRKAVNVKTEVFEPWVRHKRKWKDCQACKLCELRTQVVLCRGFLPCEILFIGEAPGESEDLLGEPFVGPAGKKLDEIIGEAVGEAVGGAETGKLFRYAITNVVCCFPRTEDGFRQPKAEEIKACRPRLEEFLTIAQPRLLVTLGNIAKSNLPKFDGEVVSLVHPSYIVRTERDNPPKANLDFKRCVMTLSRWI